MFVRLPHATNLQIVHTIDEYWEEYGTGPSFIRLSQILGYADVDKLVKRLKKLKDLGEVTWSRKQNSLRSLAMDVTLTLSD